MVRMAEQLEAISQNTAAHILEDLHELRREVSELGTAVAAVGELVIAADRRGNRAERLLGELAASVSRTEQLLTELAPAARRAAAMFASPVGRWAATGTGEPKPSRRERKGRRTDG